MPMVTRSLITIAILGTALLYWTLPAAAGCGCSKPPPPLAPIRPSFASPGQVVTFFHPDLDAAQEYVVKFKSGKGTERTVEKTKVNATTKRDFADGVIKAQLVVEVPVLSPGPATVTVKEVSSGRLFTITASEFTVLQAPLALSENDGRVDASCYRAAVGTDGTVYIPVDISAIAAHMIFDGVGLGYPLLFGAQDIAIYNTQGVLMQLLGPEEAGIFAITDPGTPHSLELTYDRHEFITYRQQHQHEAGYGLDPSDPAWHVDGTRHVDHDHLVVAINGVLEGGAPPAAGETPPFTLSVTTALAEPTSAVLSTSTSIVWGSCL